MRGAHVVKKRRATRRRRDLLVSGGQRALADDAGALYRAHPVRADRVVHPRDYPWASPGFNAQGESGPNADWLTPHRESLRLARNAADRQGPTGCCSARRCPTTLVSNPRLHAQGLGAGG